MANNSLTKPEDTQDALAKANEVGSQIKEIIKGTPIEKHAMMLGAMVQSGYFKDITSLSQAITKAMIGHEMGMGLVQSMNSLYVIDGKVHMDSHAIRNTAVMAGYTIKTLELDETKCVLEWSYTDPQSKKVEVLGTSEFTWEDATKAKLTEKYNWKQFPKDMLFARAITRGARMYANRAFANQPVYEREEIQDNGQYIDIGPLDERVDKIRNAKTTDDLFNIMKALNTDEQKALAHEINAKTKELLNGKPSTKNS